MDSALLAQVVEPHSVIREAEELRALAVDGRLPQAGVLPESVSQLSEVIKLAADQGWALAPRGAGTMMALGNPPRRLDLVVGLSRLNHVIDIDVANLTVTVQAGVVLGDLQDLLAGSENRCFFPLDSVLKEKADYLCSSREHKGVRLPLDPPFGRRATLGGIVAANASGPKRHRFGQSRDLVTGLRYVQPDGRLIGLGGKTVKNVSGYDLSKLLIGSLGTLGVITELTFRLLPLPAQEAAWTAVCQDLTSAADLARTVLDSKLLPTALELMNEQAAGFAPQSLDLKVGPGGWWLAVGVEGAAEEVSRQLDDLDRMAAQHQATATRLDKAQAAGLWDGLRDQSGSAGQASSIRLKGFFPLAGLAQVLTAWSQAARRAGQGCALQARVGLGLAWAHLESKDEGAVLKLSQEMRRVAAEAGGGMIVESAPAGLKDRLDVWGPPRSDFPLMAGLKRRLDPKGVLNPGRFVGDL